MTKQCECAVILNDLSCFIKCVLNNEVLVLVLSTTDEKCLKIIIIKSI